MYSYVPFIRNPLENVLYQNDIINQEREKHVIQRTEDTTQDNEVKIPNTRQWHKILELWLCPRTREQNWSKNMQYSK